MQRNQSDVVVITGASAGVGRATVQAFARRGARIGLLARGIKGLEGAKRDAEKLGGEGLVVPTDVAHAKQVEAAAEKVEKSFGPIDIWINAAMVSVFSPLKATSFEELSPTGRTIFGSRWMERAESITGLMVPLILVRATPVPSCGPLPIGNGLAFWPPGSPPKLRTSGTPPGKHRRGRH